MSKKFLILGVVLALAAVAAPATAKKKGPKPYKSEVVTVQVGHPMNRGNSGTLTGVTPQEFMKTCAIPATNGLDAFVFEVPADYQKINADFGATAVGTTDAAVAADVDAYFYDSSCVEVGMSNNTCTSESGIMPAGTSFVLLHNYTGGPTDMQFTLKPYTLKF